METILLNDGTLIEDAYCIETNGNLFVYLLGKTDIKQYFDLFYDPENTRVIKEGPEGAATVFTGYTEFFSISRENENINIVLRKAAS